MSIDNAPTSADHINPLRKFHRRSDFDCGVESLNLYLKNTARQNASRYHSQTFVISPSENLETVAGYYTLTLNTKRSEESPKDYHVPPEGSVPVALLARLAVDVNFQGRNLGRALLMDALRRCRDVADQVGCVAVEVDALDDNAASFYRKYGFVVIDEREPLRLYIAMATIVNLFPR